MRNCDRIKELEKELGRYKKKVADQQSVEKKLREQLKVYENGLGQLNAVSDATMIQTALRCGKQIVEGGKLLGYRLVLPRIDVEKLKSRYQLKVRVDKEDGTCTIGVVPKEAQHGED